MSREETLLAEHISNERMRRYLFDRDGKRRPKAVATYIWNAAAAGVLLEPIGYVEVALRNAIGHELAGIATTDGDEPWWTRSEWFAEHRLADIAAATDYLTRRGREITHGRLVAELNLGFWRYLLSAQYDETLWRWGVYRAFPNLTGKRSGLYEDVREINDLRNRIAHHEPIFERDLRADQARLLRVAGEICTDYRDWVVKRSRVDWILGLRP